MRFLNLSLHRYSQVTAPLPSLTAMKNTRLSLWHGFVPVFTFLAVFAAVSSSHRAVAGQNQPVAVVELFTSQACDSCPPADNFLGTLQGSPNIITISLNVDYWDYLQ